MARAGTNLRTSYLESNEVLRRPYQKLLIGLIVAAALTLPGGSSEYFLHLANLCLLACTGALGLMILTGFCGQISLGHAAFLAIGAFTTVILTVHLKMPFIVVVPAAACIRRHRRLHHRAAVAALPRGLPRDQHARHALRHHFSVHELSG